MQLIRPNCRDHLTAADMDFIVNALANDEKSAGYLREFLVDSDTRDMVLDHPALFSAMLENPAVVNVTPHLYFYIMVRRELRDFGINSCEIADYVAEMLAEFQSLERVRHPLPDCYCAMDRMVDLLLELQKEGDRRQFGVRAHMGNLALLLAGVFHRRIEHNTRYRAAPGVDYYENLGRASYEVASHHRLAEQYHLDTVYAALAEAFHDTRLALNDMTERLLTLNDQHVWRAQNMPQK